MYFLKFLFTYLVSIIIGYLIPQLTKSKVEVGWLLKSDGLIVTNTQFDITLLGRGLIIETIVLLSIYFLLRYKSSEDKKEVIERILLLFQLYICFSGFLHGMNEELGPLFIVETLVGVIISILLENCFKEKKEEKKEQIFKLYPSREISKKKLDYLLREETASSILIDGNWGIGKTYFLNYVLSDKGKDFDIFKYDALLLDSREKLIKAFLNDLKLLAKREKFFIGDSSDYFSILEPITCRFPFYFGEIFSKKKSISDSKKEFEIFSTRFKKKIIIVIDNLERLEEKKTFIEMISFLHELNGFKNIKIITLLDSKKLKQMKISEDYINKFFINRVELKKIPIQDILGGIENLDDDIELEKIIYDLERIKNDYLKINNDSELEKKIENNFQNPRIYEQSLKRYELHIKNYKNIYLQLKESEYKNTMFLSSQLYFLFPDLEKDILDDLISKGGDTEKKKAIRRDYYDTGTDLGDDAEKIMLTDDIDIRLEQYLEKLIYSNFFLPAYKSKIKEKYVKFLNELESRKNLKFNLFKIEKSMLFKMSEEVLKLEKEFNIKLEGSIIKISKKTIEFESITNYMDTLIFLYKKEIENISFYVDSTGLELSLDTLELGKEVVNNIELKDVLDIYFSSSKNIDEHLAGVLNIIDEVELKLKLEEFIGKYKALRERQEELYGKEIDVQ